MAWTTPASIVTQVRRWWDRGELLLGTGDPFPRSITVQGPKPRELATRYDEALAWVEALQAGARSSSGRGYNLVYADIRNRSLGAHRLPVEVLIPTCADALAMIGCAADAARWQDNVAATRQCCPELSAWVDQFPMAMVEAADTWIPAITVVRWFLDHPTTNCYLREIDAPGVDTKFIADHTALLARLLDAVLPPERIDPLCPPGSHFAARYRLREAPRMVRFRVLDPRLGIQGLTDISAPVEQVAALAVACDRVFITENATSALAFPPVSGSLVIFGLGYGSAVLSAVPWLRDRPVYYWGDIDTHGFDILSRLRAFLPQTTSMLMDEATFRAHPQQWVIEEVQILGDISRLTPEESCLLRLLQLHTLGSRLRLEQERIRFAAVDAWLRERRYIQGGGDLTPVSTSDLVQR